MSPRVRDAREESDCRVNERDIPAWAATSIHSKRSIDFKLAWQVENGFYVKSNIEYAMSIYLTHNMTNSPLARTSYPPRLSTASITF